jgi:hypothetical protein
MKTDRELMQQALEALKLIDEAMPFPVAKLTIKNLSERLAQPEQEPVEVDRATMELAESVRLIGPASRTHDLHCAIQRFHDLICVNATIKAAQMAADAIREATSPAAPVAWKWHQAPVKTSWGHDMVVADLAIDKDHTVSIYCERDQTAKVEAMFTSPAAQPAPVQEPVATLFGSLPVYDTTPPAALAQAAERNKVAAWMMAQGYATGHGDSVEGLLEELRWQVEERGQDAP